MNGKAGKVLISALISMKLLLQDDGQGDPTIKPSRIKPSRIKPGNPIYSQEGLTFTHIIEEDTRINLRPGGKGPLPKLPERYVTYSAPSQNPGDIYEQIPTGEIKTTVTKGKQDPTIPEKTIDANDKAKPDGVLNEALTLFAGASAGTALCFTGLALGGAVVVPALVVGGVLAGLFGAYMGGAEVYNYLNKKPPKDDTPSTKVELVREPQVLNLMQHGRLVGDGDAGKALVTYTYCEKL